ncbi:MAG: hypothetical protein BGO82_17055 [Devosia sp. 67-54]|uniref:hypothetical protein n=1 Tax=unclassified Devosia TaxID=196773 RepID=UPI0009603D00|nr:MULTISPECIES: hypothetical protein [unclassified Devosia]MBN9304082.1 hypothetical protein [Devosia sp.]OJX17919.1 MAG: hypothetical protein BGO82_17055 [Devosia sp. 67-54]
MKLALYMSQHNLSPEDMAIKIEDCSASAVLKWSRGERVPRVEQQRRIYEITDGQVTPNDFVLDQAVEP